MQNEKSSLPLCRWFDAQPGTYIRMVEINNVVLLQFEVIHSKPTLKPVDLKKRYGQS